MKQRLKFLGAFFGLWMLLFIVSRYIFIIYQTELNGSLQLKDWFLTAMWGSWMDLSMTGYFMFFTSLLMALLFFLKENHLKLVLKILNFVFVFAAFTAIIADWELYRNWGFRMDSTPLLYLKNPEEAAASLKTWQLILGLAVWGGIIWGVIKLFNRWVFKQLNDLSKLKWFWVPVWLFISAFMILPIRGGLSIAPMNTGMVYYSNNLFANHASINVLWNVFYSITEMGDLEKTYPYFEEEKAQQEFQNLFPEEHHRDSVLKTTKPNVVLIILESFTAKAMKELGGKEGVTPNLSRIAKEGILFKNFYANGDRSDKGLVSVLSAYPCHPKVSIMKFPNKSQNLTHLNSLLTEQDYSSAYYYGGDLNFANMRSYVQNSGFQKVVDLHDFPAEHRNSKWGIHDHVVFDRFFEDIQKEEEPFFNVFFTLSSHEPFDVPMKRVMKGTSREDDFLNAIYYTDSCLGEFYNKLKKSPKWDNTLLVLVADHGSSFPGRNQYYERLKFHIPMVWAGGALQVKDTIVSKVGAQVDVLPTLMGQLGNPVKVPFAKDLLSKESQSFAFYAFNDGFGFITDSTQVVFSNVNQKSIESETNSNKHLNTGKSYLQVLANDLQKR